MISNRITTVVFSPVLKTIDQGAFFLCTSLTSVTIPNSVTKMDGYVFLGCSNLKEIKIDNIENSISGAPWGAPNATVTWLR